MISDDMPVAVDHGYSRRAITACAGAALCMAAGGLWLMPSADAAMQLMKLTASVVLLLGGLVLFEGLSRDKVLTEVQIDPSLRQLRLYDRDQAGFCRLRAIHDIDALESLSVRRNRLQAKGPQGKVLVDIPLASTEAANAVRGMLPRAS